MWHHGFCGFRSTCGFGKTLGKLDLFSLQLPIIPSHNQVTWYKMLWLWVTDIVHKDGWSIISCSKEKSAFKGSISVQNSDHPHETLLWLCICEGRQSHRSFHYQANNCCTAKMSHKMGSGDTYFQVVHFQVEDPGITCEALVLEKWFLDILWLWNTRYPGTIWNDHISHPNGKFGKSSSSKKSHFWWDMWSVPLEGVGHLSSTGSQGWGFHALGIPCRGRVYKDRSRLTNVTNRWYKDLFVGFM